MNCRNCGAAMQPVGGAAYFRCLHCGTFDFPNATDEGVATLGEASEFPCPVCRQSLGTAAIEGHDIFYCGTCRGFLTTNPNFSAILLHRRARLGEQSSVPRSIDPTELRRRVGCPKCKRVMDAHPYGGGGNVVIDTCYRCHLVWLDAGEMETLARHRPKCGTSGLGTAVAKAPVHAAGQEEDQLGWRWGGDDTDRWGDDNGSNTFSLLDLFRRLF